MEVPKRYGFTDIGQVHSPFDRGFIAMIVAICCAPLVTEESMTDNAGVQSKTPTAKRDTLFGMIYGRSNRWPH